MKDLKKQDLKSGMKEARYCSDYKSKDYEIKDKDLKVLTYLCLAMIFVLCLTSYFLPLFLCVAGWPPYERILLVQAAGILWNT